MGKDIRLLGKMKSALLICTTICVACSWALNDDFTSTKLNTNSVFLNPFDTLPEDSQFNDPPQIVNGEYITPLDHFSPTEPRRLLMNYQAHVQFFEDNGPIFVNINWFEGIKWITSGLAFDLAQKLGGALVTSDIRMLGRNVITNATDEHLQFYTIDQMVGDVAHLVRQVRENFAAENSKVVVFGSRFGGTIATLARKKFPHLIDGVWSSGGVFRFTVPNPSYFNTLSWNIFHRGSIGCAKNLSIALGNLTKLVEAKDRTRLTQLFRICDDNDFSHAQDAATFYEIAFLWIGNYIDTRQYFGGIQDICRDLSRGPDPLTAFSRWVEYTYYNNNQCRNVSYNDVLRRRPRFPIYLQCSQVGLNFVVTSANATGDVFPDVLSSELPENRCRDLFGNAFNPTLLQRAAENFNIQHGSQNQIISNAIFSFGDLDPFSDFGIIEYDVDSSEVARTSLHSSAADMTSLSDSDTADLRATKRQIQAALSRFTEQRRPPNSSFIF